MESESISKSSLRFLTLLLIAVLGLVKTGCDYSIVEEPEIIPALKISITPQTAEMQEGTTLNLSAVISGYKSNGAVTWEFSGPASGELLGSGLTATYKAPASIVSSPLIVAIRVRSVEDTARYATAVLTILDTVTNGGSNNGGNGNQITLSVSPGSATIEPGETLQFTATVTGTTNLGVNWLIATGLGTISSNGLYAAPSTITATQTTTIEASLVGDPTVKATANVTVRKPIDPNLVCFNPTIIDIFASNCVDAGCHNSNDRADGYDLTTYASIKRAVDKDGDGDRGHKILEALRDDDPEDRMPLGKAPLSEEKIRLIEKWIAQGAQDIDCSDPGSGNGSGCDTLNLSFATHINPIFEAKCAGCHSGSNPPRGISLADHAGIRSAANSGRLIGAISHQSGFSAMPVNGTKLDDCSIAKIKAWINAGTPNN